MVTNQINNKNEKQSTDEGNMAGISGFDNEKYIKEQTSAILERVERFKKLGNQCAGRSNKPF